METLLLGREALECRVCSDNSTKGSDDHMKNAVQCWQNNSYPPHGVVYIELIWSIMSNRRHAFPFDSHWNTGCSESVLQIARLSLESVPLSER